MKKNSKQCFFCSQNLKDINWKDVQLLRRFISFQGKIIDPKHTGVCSKHQRMLAKAIKKARQMALISSIKKYF